MEKHYRCLFTLSVTAFLCSGCQLQIFKQLLQVLGKRYFCDTFVSNAMCYRLHAGTKDFNIWHSLGHRRPITPKSKDIRYTILTLPGAKCFLIFSCLPLCFWKRILVQKFFFTHNVRYGNSVTFRIRVALESLQYLDIHESQLSDFCIEWKPTDRTCQS